MLKVSGIHMLLDAEASCRGGQAIVAGPLLDAAAKALGIPAGEIGSVRVLRRSVDARRKNQVHFVISAAVEFTSEESEAQLVARGIAPYKPYVPLEIPVVGHCDNQPNTQQHEQLFVQQDIQPDVRPVVVGTGPAGLFAALYLARAGMCPLVIERGEAVEQRAETVAHFNATGQLNAQSNIQFGEGGAGTFSDGKLTTNTNNRYTTHVLHWFAEAGAPPEILWEAQPHIGSDRLPAVVAAMRNEIIARGGQVLFNTQLTDLRFEDGTLAEIEISTQQNADQASLRGAQEEPSAVRPDTGCDTGLESRWIPCTQLVLACGHSARDTFELLHTRGVHLEQKPFSVGVRIEHPQAIIDASQWGSAATHPALGAASYKLAAHGCAGRSVYTFCMCPGGEVVCAASEEGGIATNGMSPFARNGKFANAAVLVGVGPADFGEGADPLAGMRFQREIEQRAYQVGLEAGGKPYQVPAQTVGSFLDAGCATKAGEESATQDEGGAVQDSDTPLPHQLETSCARGTIACDLRIILPPFVCDAITEALPQLDRKLVGFASPGAMLLGPETRSSSPVRIARNDACQARLEGAPQASGCGIYPAGEGAGYAGGIMSAACDGLRVASALVSKTMQAE